MTTEFRTYLKHHTEALVKDVGIEAACSTAGKSKATLGRYYSPHDEHAERFIPVDAVVALERAASYPHVTAALAELAGLSVSFDRNAQATQDGDGHVTDDIVILSERFAMLMRAYANAIADSVITPAEAKELLGETLELQKVLIDMKLHLEAQNHSA